MKFIINKRYDYKNNIPGSTIKSELRVDLETREIEYCRIYKSFDSKKSTDNEKEEYKIKTVLKTNISRFKHLNNLIKKIKEENILNNITINNDVTLEYLKYIELNIDGINYYIDITSIEYELLIHLSTYEFFDKCEIKELEKIS